MKCSLVRLDLFPSARLNHMDLKAGHPLPMFLKPPAWPLHDYYFQPHSKHMETTGQERIMTFHFPAPAPSWFPHPIVQLGIHFFFVIWPILDSCPLFPHSWVDIDVYSHSVTWQLPPQCYYQMLMISSGCTCARLIRLISKCLLYHR